MCLSKKNGIKPVVATTKKGVIILAHFAKFTSGAVGHITEHFDRSAKEKIGNENVDLSRSHLNYNLAEQNQPKKQIDFIRQRLSEVKVQKRKDVNVLCDWVVTAPKDLPEKDEKKFFEETYNFLEQMYGKKNVVSAYVHNDEITPHLHFAFIPVVPDVKKGGFKVSAKECITKSDLSAFHKLLSKHLEIALGRDVGILNGATEVGNLTIKQLKAKEVEKTLKNTSKRLSEAENGLLEVENYIEVEHKWLGGLETTINERKSELTLLNNEIKLKNEHLQQTADEEIEQEFTKGFGKHKEVVSVKIKKQVYDKLVNQSSQSQMAQKMKKLADEEIERLKERLKIENVERLENENRKLEEDKFQLENENRKLENENQKLEQESEKIIDKVNSVLKKIDDFSSSQFVEKWNEEKIHEIKQKNNFEMEI